VSDQLECRWDDAVETAWREFRQRLADHLATMVDGDSIVVEMMDDEVHGTTPYCQVAAGEGDLRVEAVSNAYLALECQLVEAQEVSLEHMGFRRPKTWDWEEGETNFWADLEQREADRAAVMIVGALREVHGVLHPVYLDAGGLEPQAVGDDTLAREPDLDEPVRTRSVEDVRAIIDLVVADFYDDSPEWDDDGDLGLPTEHHVLWVSVNGHAPRVLLSCMLLDEVDDADSALVEINRLNRAEWGLTFTLHERRISVTRELGLSVAVPLAVQGEIQRLLSQVDGWGRDLAERVRTGAEAPAKNPASSRFATAYAVMAELEREQRGSVGPAAMVRIYGNDTGLLLKAIRITEQRRRDARGKAREARDQGQRAREKMCRARHDYLRDLAARMRAGLRLMVDAPVRKVQVDQLALFDEDEAGTSR
jgi:hypothetical protein